MSCKWWYSQKSLLEKLRYATGLLESPLNSAAYELGTDWPLRSVLWIFTVIINLNENFADLIVYTAIFSSTKAIPGINLLK